MNYLRLYFTILVLLLFAINSKGQQSKYIVYLTSKSETGFSLTQPSAYLSARAIERRTRYNISIDSTDLPVVEKYVDSIRTAGIVTILGRLRWINAVMIQTTDAAALNKINSFSFVKSKDSIALRSTYKGKIVKNNPVVTALPANERNQQIAADVFQYGASSTQVKMHNGDFLHNIGATGHNMYMAFLDGGFFGYLTNPLFDSVRLQNRFLATKDFVLNEVSVNEDNAHGMQCLSTVASNKPGVFTGSAPHASFFLLRTEDVFTEQLIEEYNWALGAEYADSAGVDVISSSVGYSTFDNTAYDHTYAQMNGNTTIVSKHADMAAKKGLLVVNSNGNEGDKSWKFLVAPADGDSVLAVGAVNSSNLIAAFSSFGPTSDGQVKADVVSLGQGATISTTSGTPGTSNGTSFSAPNMAGLATCLWQLFPEVNNQKIITTLHKSSDKYLSPQPQYGYGLPDMKTAVGLLVAELSTANSSVNNCTATIQWGSKDIASMQYKVERKLPGETNYSVIQTVAAKGTVFSAQNYSINDAMQVSGIIQYRITQVMDTNTTSYRAYAIDSVSVTAGSSCATTNILDPAASNEKIKLFPNPASTGKLFAQFKEQSNGNFVIQIVNVQGKVVQQELYNKPSGAATKQINLRTMPSGKYLLVVFKNGERYSSSGFIKQ
ncbi:T9SS type A sorting domain-containing protein [Lacibacter luteus]|uniref:T9SS type A sorting domain-containing protein n=1 Tax=Lacibacter luteus TaxID=2508719 RepID=A0A4Q1CEE5_9BACT|nr:S8 family serine peptidase [Lacibacter luteus]RXK57842.1 T9SS type A sorting domain-containing protein [Lacibacter luteus]